MSDPFSVNVQFFGICTHFTPEFMPKPVDWSHRTVLVNASVPDRFRPAHPSLDAIAAHVARLQIRVSDLWGSFPATPWFPVSYFDGNIVEWELNGVQLMIGGVIPSAGGPTSTCGPTLTQYAEGHEIRPGLRSYEGDSLQTSCFFDFIPVVSPQRYKLPLAGDPTAAVTMITASTNNPSLIVTRFGDGGETLQFPLRPDAFITVSNIPADPAEDHDDDFRLHYLTVEPFDFTPGSPPAGMVFSCPLLPGVNMPRKIEDGATPGCSDSNYP